MAMATIDRVHEAERKAGEEQDNADLEAERIVADAQAKAKQIIADAKAKVQADDDRRTGEARAKAQEQIRAAKETAEQDAIALKEKTMKLKQNLINQLIRESL